MLLNILIACGLLWLFSYAFVLLDNFIDEAIDFIRFKVLKQKVRVTRSFDIFEDLKTPPMREAYLKVYRFFNFIKEFPMDFYRESRWFIQRGQRGYSDRDVWGFDYYLTEVLIKGLKDLKKNKHGYPITVIDEQYLGEDGHPTEEGDRVNAENWDKILQTIINTFETASKIENDHWYYQESKSYSEKRAEKYRKMNRELREAKPDLYEEGFGHVLTKAECKQYEEGWKYFQKYFFNLWD